MRAILGDSSLPPDRDPLPRVWARLEDDVLGSSDVETLPTLTVRQRARTGFDDQGSPTFDWGTVVEGVATLWAERTETDDVAGMTRTLATATILYSGDTIVTESALVWSSFGGTWRVSSVARLPDRLEFALERWDGT